MEQLSRERLMQVIPDEHRMIRELRTEIEQLKRRGAVVSFSQGANKTNPCSLRLRAAVRRHSE